MSLEKDLHNHLSDSINAMSFATNMLMNIELSQVELNTKLNPYNITPVALDETLQESYLFKNLITEPASWKKCGVNFMPQELLITFPVCAKYLFSRESCSRLDCFGYRNLSGTVCLKTDKQVSIDTPAGNLEGCRPACFQLKQALKNYVESEDLKKANSVNQEKPSNIYIYYDDAIAKCRFGCHALRQYCIMPRLRVVNETRGVTDVPPFYWEDQTQSCSITEAYCKGYFAVDYENGECVERTGQKIAELFVGRNAFRKMKKWTGGKETDIAYLQRRERQRRQRAIHNHQLQGHLNDFLPVVNLEKLDTSATASSSHAALEILKKFGEVIGSLVILLGVQEGVHLSIRTFQRFLNETIVWATEHLAYFSAAKLVGEHGIELACAAVSRKLLATFSVRITAEILASAVELLNPALFALDVLSIASVIWDLADQKFLRVVDKKTLTTLQNEFIKNWNLNRNTVTVDGRLVVKEVTPMFLYTAIFGSCLDKSSQRYSEAHVKSFLYFAGMYLKYLKVLDDGEVLQDKETASRAMHAFSTGFKSKENIDRLMQIGTKTKSKEEISLSEFVRHRKVTSLPSIVLFTSVMFTPTLLCLSFRNNVLLNIISFLAIFIVFVLFTLLSSLQLRMHDIK